MKKNKVIYSSIGSEHSYAEVWELQTHFQQKLIRAKRSGIDNHPGYLLLCEHDPIYTLGKSGKIDNLLISEEEVEQGEFEFFKINRGGDITYHGPGQITGYPILDLDQYYNDLHRYVRDLEEVIIRTLAKWEIVGGRVEGFTGVWIGNGLDEEAGHVRKICAIGVHMSRWVSMHGFALNVNTNLDHFKNIIPCGIQEDGMQVTSMKKELGKNIDLNDVQAEIRIQMMKVFNCNII